MSGYETGIKDGVCPGCTSKAFTDNSKPATTVRKSVRAWLKGEKEKAEKAAASQAKSPDGDVTGFPEDPQAASTVQDDGQQPLETVAGPVEPQQQEVEIAVPADEPDAANEVGFFFPWYLPQVLIISCRILRMANLIQILLTQAMTMLKYKSSPHKRNKNTWHSCRKKQKIKTNNTTKSHSISNSSSSKPALLPFRKTTSTTQPSPATST
jgi:hypothetical protein